MLSYYNRGSLSVNYLCENYLSMGDLIKQKVDSIAECIFAKIQKQEEKFFGLYNGEFGILLFLFYYSRYSKNKTHILLTEKYAERLLELFIEKEKMHTFCSGFSGILYLFEFLRENDIIDLDISGIQQILEKYIVARMRQDIKQQNFDFMHGAIGVGLYFLKRKTNPEYIHELVEFLYSIAEKDNDNHIFKWKSVIDDEKNLSGYNISLSHGMSSIIIFLSRVILNGIKDEKVFEVLSCTVSYILAQQIDFMQYGSCFPIYSLESSDNVLKSRLAWCYGDLGIGMSLLQAGKAIDNKEWKEKGLEILLKSTKRRSYQDSFVVEAGICHGSAGIELIFRRMYLEMGLDEFNDASKYWITKTLDFSQFEDGLAGYKTLFKDTWICEYSLLAGISGIGLVLLSYLENSTQDWDEMLLLS